MKIYSFLELHVTCLCTYLQKKKTNYLHLCLQLEMGKILIIEIKNKITSIYNSNF